MISVAVAMGFIAGSVPVRLLHSFDGPLSRTTRVSRYQKGKTNLDFTEVRDSEWQWHQLGHMHVCTSLQTDNHASTPPLSFLQAGCPFCHPTNSVKALKGSSVPVRFMLLNGYRYVWVTIGLFIGLCSSLRGQWLVCYRELMSMMVMWLTGRCLANSSDQPVCVLAASAAWEERPHGDLLLICG